MVYKGFISVGNRLLSLLQGPWWGSYNLLVITTGLNSLKTQWCYRRYAHAEKFGCVFGRSKLLIGHLVLFTHGLSVKDTLNANVWFLIDLVIIQKDYRQIILQMSI